MEGGAAVYAHGDDRLVQLGFIAAGMLDARFRVVWNDDLGNAVDELQRVNVRADPAGQILASGGFGEGVIAGAKHGDQQGCFEIQFAAPGIIDRNLVAGVIDEQPLSGAVFLPQNHVQLASPVPV